MSSFASTSLAFGEEDAITETLMESDKKPSAVKKTERAILQALKADVDALAKQFLSGTDLDLHRFVELFNEMEFPTIFLGQFSYSDLVEFSENLFHYIGSYMFGPLTNPTLPDYIKGWNVSQNRMDEMFPRPTNARTTPERVFGIFLTYSLYFMQPSQFVIPVFVTVPQLDDLHEFMRTVLLPEENFQALYCLFRLVQSNAFAIHPFDGKFNPMLHRHFDLFDQEGGQAENRRIENAGELKQLRELSKDPLFLQAEAMHQLYTDAKQQNAALLRFPVTQSGGPQETMKRIMSETETNLAKIRAARQAEVRRQQNHEAANDGQNRVNSLLAQVKAAVASPEPRGK